MPRSISELKYIHKGLNLGSSQITQLRQDRTESLLKEKKLILILDLDHTLIHSTPGNHLSRNNSTQYLAQLKQDASVFWWIRDNKVIKVRPFAREFLKEASEMFDMYIYTKGCRAYGSKVAKILDPQGIYFKSKVISIEDSTEPSQKGLDIVLGDERVVLILDDKERVWARHRENLLLVNKYRFFGVLPRIKCEDESDGGLEEALGIIKDVHRRFFEQSADSLEGTDVRKLLKGYHAFMSE